MIFINADPFDSKDRSQIPAKVLLFAEGLYRRRGLRDHLHPFDSISWMQGDIY